MQGLPRVRPPLNPPMNLPRVGAGSISNIGTKEAGPPSGQSPTLVLALNCAL